MNDKALDTLGEVLRSYAEQAFDVDGETAELARVRFLRWSKHLLVGGAHPDTPDAGPASSRDFAGLRRAFARHRDKERRYAEGLVGLIWDTMRGLRRAFDADRRADDDVGAKLTALSRAAETADLEALRRQVIGTVDAVRESLVTRAQRHDAAMRTLGKQLGDLRGELAEAQTAATTDSLTQLHNRGAFDKHMETATQIAALTGEPLSLLMIDVDHFKRLNDRHGHELGDRALQRIADAVVREACRRTDFVARYGGEELVAVLGETPGDGALVLAERIRGRIGRIDMTGRDGKPLPLSVSIGVATLARRESTASFLGRADQALYAAKRSGRDRCLRAEAILPAANVA